MPTKPVLLFYHHHRFAHVAHFDSSVRSSGTSTNNADINLENVLWQDSGVGCIDSCTYPTDKSEVGDAQGSSGIVVHVCDRNR